LIAVNCFGAFGNVKKLLFCVGKLWYGGSIKWHRSLISQLVVVRFGWCSGKYFISWRFGFFDYWV